MWSASCAFSSSAMACQADSSKPMPTTSTGRDQRMDLRGNTTSNTMSSRWALGPSARTGFSYTLTARNFPSTSWALRRISIPTGCEPSPITSRPGPPCSPPLCKSLIVCPGPPPPGPGMPGPLSMLLDPSLSSWAAWTCSVASGSSSSSVSSSLPLSSSPPLALTVWLSTKLLRAAGVVSWCCTSLRVASRKSRCLLEDSDMAWKF
mmetsp:Transcript_7269/g.16621  ORF Transcript_7269/g.16621 Transcript_7269/m.16621 type:complete len:206 (-) Transcript_7269:1655-2272(-)